MIVMKRKDICKALLDMSEANANSDEPLDPENLPDSALLETMNKHHIDEADLPLVRQAYQETITVLQHTNWNPSTAASLLFGRKPKNVH